VSQNVHYMVLPIGNIFLRILTRAKGSKDTASGRVCYARIKKMGGAEGGDRVKRSSKKRV